MKVLDIRVGLTIATVSAAHAAYGLPAIQVTFDFASGSPTTSLYDVYIFGALLPEGSTPAAMSGPYAVSGNGATIISPNPGQPSDEYTYMFLGLYNDTTGAAHVAVGDFSDLSGQSWNYWFDSSTSFVADPEPTIISDLEAPGGSTLLSLASNVMSLNVYGVRPINGNGYGIGSAGTAQITGFSNGEHIGTATSVLEAVPEPSCLLGLVGLLPLCLRHRRRNRAQA